MQLRIAGHSVYAATGGRPFDAGKPAMLFLHGAGQDHTVWQPPARYFAWHGYGVLAVDLPGHGRSEGPALETIPEAAHFVGQLMDAAGIDEAALVGHSMGAAVAIEAAAALKTRISRVALFGVGSAMPVNETLLTCAQDDAISAYQMIVGWGHGPRAKVGGNSAPGLWMVGGSMALLLRNRPGVLRSDLEACNRWTSGPPSAQQVRCPALVVIGAMDAMTPPKSGQALARHLALSRTLTIEEAGHMLMVEAPDPTLDALIEFFAAAPPAP